MNEGTGGDEVEAEAGEAGEAFQGDAAGGFGEGAAVDEGEGAAEGGEGEVVEEDDIGPGVEHGGDLGEVINLDLDGEIGRGEAGAADGGGEGGRGGEERGWRIGDGGSWCGAFGFFGLGGGEAEEGEVIVF